MSVNNLGPVALDDNLRLYGVQAQATVAMSVRPTFGAPVTQRCARSGGDTLTLVASVSGNQVRGVFTLTQVEAIATLRDLGEPVSLVHHLGTFTVMIPPTALDGLEQVMDYANPGADEWYTGTIPLITI